jgi:hypothetical protein
MNGLEQWLLRRRRAVLVAIVAASVLIRVVYFLELCGGPCLWQHRWDQSDMHFFDAWARTLSAGDWLTDRSLHPYARWHEQIAAVYFREHPEEKAALEVDPAPRGGRADPARLLWDRWYGGKRFHQEPLYPYLIGFTYALLGADVRWVFGWQLALGVAGNVLIYLIAARYFGTLVATLAALLAVLCGPLLFYELVLLRTTLITLTGLLLVYAADRTLERNTWRPWLLCGLVLGLALLLNTTFAVFGLGLGCWLVYRRATVPILALAAGTALCIAPVTARNLTVGVPPLAISSVGALAFMFSNTEDYSPRSGFSVASPHVPRILAAANGRSLPVVVETLRTHSSVGSYTRLLWGKFVEAWHWYEQPNNANFYYYRLHSVMLRYLPVTFWTLAPLALAGLFLAAPRLPRLIPLYLLVLSSVSPLVLFYVLSRFRVPLVAALIPFAGLTLVRLAEWCWTRRLAPVALLLGAICLISLCTARPLPPNRALIGPADYGVPYAIYYGRAAEEALKAGDPQAAVDRIAAFLRYEPKLVGELGRGRQAETADQAGVAAIYGYARRRYAEALDALGEQEAAAAERRRAAELHAAAAAFRGGRGTGRP